MPGQATRKKSVRQKLSPMETEFEGKSVLLVDDSIIRGRPTAKSSKWYAQRERVSLCASAAPEVRYPNVYGIDMPTREELIANGRSAANCRRNRRRRHRFPKFERFGNRRQDTQSANRILRFVLFQRHLSNRGHRPSLPRPPVRREIRLRRRENPASRMERSISISDTGDESKTGLND